MLTQDINDYERSTAQYFNEISKYKSLTKEEEKDLFKDYYENGNMKARDKILEANLKFVVSIAKHYKGRGLSFADLIAEGNDGMFKAFDKFDTTKDVKFISYAVWWIKQSIKEALGNRAKENSKTDSLPDEFKDIDNEINEELGVEEDIEINETFLDTENAVYNKKEKEKEMSKIIESLTADLTPKEMLILNKRYRDDKTLEEIGREYNLTKERIRQINEKTLKKLRTRALMESITSDITR